MTAEQKQFAAELAPLVERVGGPTTAAEICGVSRQALWVWLQGKGKANKATRVGTIVLLREAAEEKH